jgi:hypothetical protein
MFMSSVINTRDVGRTRKKVENHETPGDITNRANYLNRDKHNVAMEF